MEKGSFQPNISQLNFTESTWQESATNNQPLHSQRVQSLQSLLQQNEDLSIRLKFSIQKMAELEDNNNQTLTDNRKLQNTIQALNDQLLIWKEKERLWQERFNKSEFQLAELRQSFPDIQDLRSELSRYHRYHEKVKTQIKPYIQQLKDYAKGLSEHIGNLNIEIERRDFEIQQVTTKNKDLEEDLSSHLATHAQIMSDLKNFYEAEVANLSKENTHLRNSLLIAEKKAEQLDSALERQDELLNQTIVLKRKTEDIRLNYLHESEGLKQSLAIARNEIIQKTAFIDEITENHTSQSSELAQQKELVQQLQDQLSGLRILWTDKCADVERLSLANESLQKINVELSQKLLDSRKNS